MSGLPDVAATRTLRSATGQADAADQVERPVATGEPTGLDAASLLLAVPEAILVVREGDIETANDRAAEITQTPDLRGTPIRRLIPDWRDDADAAVPYEASLLLSGGDAVPVEIRTARVHADVVVASVRDARGLVAARETESAREEAEAKYRTLVEQIPAIVYVDVEGAGTTYVSPQIERILGVTPATYCESPTVWRNLLHPDDRERVETEYASFLEGEAGDLADYRMLTPDGRTVWIRDRAVAVRNAEGHVLLEHGVMFDITELKEAEASIAHMAFHDGLTGLPNRGAFEESLKRAIDGAARHDRAVAVLYLDLDNFKLLNDSLGHHAGDELLTQLAGRLHTLVRGADLVARQGGDEFLVLLANLEHGLHGQMDHAIAATTLVADRLREALQAPFDLGGTPFYARGSVGISMYPRDAADAQTLMKNADAAMYRAKRHDPGRHVFYASDGDDPFQQLAYSTRLREAVEREQWVLHYQPVIDLLDGRVVGAEALIRWQDATGGLVPPGEFIPIAEELGLIEAIGEWVIGEVVRQLRDWRAEGLDLEVSFNLSPRELWAPGLAQRILGPLSDAGVPPSSVVVEITESTAMADPDRTQTFLSELRSRGVKLAIDDFGTGYSSLARLKHMPVDILKIDQAFVRDVHADPRLAGMVRAMVQVAQSLDMLPLAEGIETQAEYEFLRANGCRLAQGFFFARPMPAEELGAFVTRRG